jgi:hypothetical protein
MPSRKSSERVLVERAQKRLADALDEACTGKAAAEFDTGELIKVEEVLAIANDAAKEAISLRRRLRRDEVRDDATEETSTEGPSTAIHRVFDDQHGIRWNAFAVYPTQTAKAKSTLPEQYRTGWLSFNSITETRRVAPIPERWTDLPDDTLRQLCETAEVARRSSREGPATT